VIFERSELSGHPRFMAYVSGAGTIPGTVADLVAAGLNANVGGWQLSPAATEIELHLMRWFASELFRLPKGSGGLVLSGGAMANFVGLKTARDHRAGWNVRLEGLAGHPRLTMYMSTETHVVSSRGADMLGIGTEGVRMIPVDDDYRMSTDALRAAIADDRALGFVPFAIVASAGTVSTGVIDPLSEIADICRDEGLWFHVDGAIGALGYLSPLLRPRLLGLERADSLAFDLHKWAQVPYDAGCLLVRDGALHAATFQVEAGYLGSLPGGVVPHDSHAFHRFTPGLSRADRALKIWMTFQAYGLQRIIHVFEANVEQAQYLATRVAQHAEFVLLNSVALNIVCFRYRAERSSPEASDALHERALLALQTSGFAVLSPYRHENRLCFRVALSNHRTRHADLDGLLERLAQLAQEPRT